MKLSEYLQINGLSLAEFARLCRTSTSTIMRARDQEVVPSKRVLDAIWKASDGQVCPNDIIDIHPREDRK